MPTDPDDPRCHECGEPVGVGATYCMHCGADLVDEDPDAADRTDADDYDTAVDDFDTGLEDSTPDEIDYDTGLEDSTPDEIDSTPGRVTRTETVGTGADGDDAGADPFDENDTGRRESSTGSGRLLDPDGLLDNSMTVVVGVVGGLLVGVLSLFVFALALGAAGVALAFLAWIGSTVVFVRQRTVFGAVQYAAYGTALALVALPIAALLAADSPIANRLVAAVAMEVVAGTIALVIAGVGYVAGHADVD